MYSILLSSTNRKYDPFLIVKGCVMTQWYTLYVFYILMAVCNLPMEGASASAQKLDFGLNRTV